MAGTLYAILRHEGVEQPHFDLMFQTEPGSMLATWRIDAWPSLGKQAAEKLPDHRQDYLTFEGEISGGRGVVRRVEQGICQAERMADGEWKILLQSLPGGEKRLIHLQQESGGGWLCITALAGPAA